jgi:hypothetical protein
LTIDQPLHAKFARLTLQEEKSGLLDDSATIRTNERREAARALFGFIEDEKSIPSQLMVMTAMPIRKSW